MEMGCLDIAISICYVLAMSINELERELTDLPPEQQDRLAAYLVHLRQQRDPKVRKELADRINDRDPSHWVTLDELKQRWKE